MKILVEKIDRWIFLSYAPVVRSLPLFRIFFSCFLITYYLPRNLRVWTLPQSFFEPRFSPASFFSGFPPQWFFKGTDYLLELGAFCLLFGCRTRFFSLLLAGLIVLVNSFQYATGKVAHDILVPAALFCLAWSDWGRHYSSDARRLPPAPRSSAPAWPLALLMLTISLCMLTAAISKAKSGWLDPSIECCRGQLLLNYVGLERPKMLADYLLAINSSVFWKFLDISTVILEGAFVVAMFWLVAMRFVTAMACVFHSFIYFTMNIFFIANPAAYASLIDFRFLLRYQQIRRCFRYFIRFARRVQVTPLAFFVAIFYGIYLAAGAPDWKDNVVLDSVTSLILLIAGIGALLILTVRKSRKIGTLPLQVVG